MADERLEIAKVAVEFGGFALAILMAWTGFEKAHRDRNEALKQARRDLQWRQTVEAQRAVQRMTTDLRAQNAMTILDWNNRQFEIRDGLRERITWEEMRRALRAGPGPFQPKEVFVRDCFDALFDHFQMIQQQIENELFDVKYVLYPVGYFARRMRLPANWPAIHGFLHKYDYPLAKSLIQTTCGYSISAAEADTDAALRLEE
jgi:hypothetical protein